IDLVVAGIGTRADAARPQQVEVPVEIDAITAACRVETPVFPPPHVAARRLNVLSAVGVDQREDEDIQRLHDQLDYDWVVRLLPEGKAGAAFVRLAEVERE